MENSEQKSVHFLPSHPCEGWLSMDRYWRELRRCAANSRAGFVYSSPLDGEREIRLPAGRLHKWWARNVGYPSQIRQMVHSGVVHVLDHSYADMLRFVPSSVKKVVTVHDIIPLIEPEGLSAAQVERFRARVEWIREADLILADSLSTKLDLVREFELEADQVRVEPIGSTPFDAQAGEIPVEGEFLLSIGSNLKRKNLGVLPEMLQLVRAERPNVKLVRVGEFLTEELVDEFALRCGEDALVELGKVSDGVLAGLYQRALATVVPSSYEGFGLPVLEAMSAGCPVACSNATSLPEVGGDVAQYFSPDHAEAGAMAVLRILKDAGLRERLCVEGRKRAGEFTWEGHFARLEEIYTELSHG